MGTSSSWGQVTAKLNGLADAYEDLPKAQVAESSLIVKKSVQVFMPARLRGAGKRGAKLTVRYNEGVYPDGAKSLVYVTGPAQLIERDTQPHLIPRQRGARARQRYAVIPGVGVRAFANHPGTKGKHPWAKGVEAAMPRVRRVFEVKADLALRRIF